MQHFQDQIKWKHCKLKLMVKPPVQLNAWDILGTMTFLLSHLLNIKSSKHEDLILVMAVLKPFRGIYFRCQDAQSSKHVIFCAMYGSENWCLTDQCIKRLDSFIRELSKRLLKFPQWFSNTPAIIICGLRSTKCMCLCRKLRNLVSYIRFFWMITNALSALKCLRLIWWCCLFVSNIWS